MNSVCKHIVSTLKQRQKELDEGADYVDENDKIAKRFAVNLRQENTKTATICKVYTAHK